MSVQQFIDDLGLDLAVETTGENPDLPPEFGAPFLTHYRMDIMRYDPYRTEHFTFSSWSGERPDPMEVLPMFATRMNEYYENPEPSAWAAAHGMPDVAGIHEHWGSFARDEAKLRRLFGEEYERFLALDPRRGA